MPILDVKLAGYLHVPNGCTVTGTLENELTLPCGKVLKFWLSVELLSDPAAPDADPRDLDSAELLALGIHGPDYNDSAELDLEEDEALLTEAGVYPATPQPALPMLTLAAQAMLRDQVLPATAELGLDLVLRTHAALETSVLQKSLPVVEGLLTPLSPQDVEALAVRPEEEWSPAARAASNIARNFISEMHAFLMSGKQEA